MDNKYSSIMKSIKVTEGMHKRILEKISNTDFDKIPNVYQHQSYKKYILTAACFIMLFAGIIGANNIIVSHQNRPSVQSDPNVNVIPNIKEVGSIEELSQTAGFEVTELENIPFEVHDKTYTVLWDTLAQIKYTGDDNELTYRKSAGSEDISGDYNVYNTEKTIDIDDCKVTLRGNDGTYNLAVWQKDGYSYSIMVSNGISESEMTAMIKC